MKKLFLTSFIYSGLLSASMFTTVNANPLPQPANLAKDIHIELLIANDNLPALGLTTITQLQPKIIANLHEWGYPLTDKPPYSHRLEAVVGQISKQSTPVGFSFSTGNSDPRATDYQKANVLPISCRLSELSSQTQLMEKSTTFSANSYQPGLNPTQISAKLIDQISNICLEVLEQASFPKASTISGTQVQPKWLPDVKMQVIETQKLQADAPITIKPNGIQPPETEKTIIINNQGTPLILRFGPDRR
jgi:hypothetical protein